MTLQIGVMALSLYLVYATTLVHSSIDPYKSLGIILNPNGTLTRLIKIPQSPPSPDPTLCTPVLSKDLTVNQSKNTWARLYLPHKALDNPPNSNSKLPLFVFYHGGGFILADAAFTYFHNFCVNVVNQTQSLVVSVNYRLAPEHRLPAAFEDSVEALHWIKTSKDPWLTRHADFSRCYLMGDSAGGNIAYNVGLLAAAKLYQIEPLKIQGLILIQPFFGGRKRTSSEKRLAEDETLPLAVTDLMWNLSLPIGVNRDYKYSNPMAKGGAKVLNRIRVLMWRVAVFRCEGDPLVDRQKEFVELLQRKGVLVEGKFYEGGRHGIFLDDPSMSQKVYHLIQSLH